LKLEKRQRRDVPERTRSVLTPERNWELLTDWALLELDLGGPDPHLDMAAHMIKSEPDEIIRAWKAACYIAVYTVAGGEILWTELPNDPTNREIAAAVEKVWPYLSIRNERRVVRSKPKLVNHLRSVREWVFREYAEWDVWGYTRLWYRMNEKIKYSGRYAIMKFIEELWRADAGGAHAYDMRAAGAWSPRLTLSYLYPVYFEELNGGNSGKTLTLVDEVFQRGRRELAYRLDREIDPFTFEVILCNYRQSLKGKYPGRGHDSELKYAVKAAPYWQERGEDSQIWKTRAELYDIKCLGEISGWTGARKDLEKTMSKTGEGYYWSDLLYDYMNTPDTNTTPVPWSPKVWEA
jgi:hypothetical protein